MIEGIFTVEDAAKAGVPRWKLAKMANEGKLERLARGVYVRSGAAVDGNYEMEVLARRGTEFVVALESSLRFHGFTSAMPHGLTVAMKRGARKPGVDFPLKVVRLSDKALNFGVERSMVNGVEVKVFSPAKTVADMFKFRNKVGLDAALESMKEGLRLRKFTVDELMASARVDRVEKVVTAYVEGYFA